MMIQVAATKLATVGTLPGTEEKFKKVLYMAPRFPRHVSHVSRFDASGSKIHEVTPNGMNKPSPIPVFP
jgi:hypothetical protein